MPPQRDEDHLQRRDEQRPTARGSPFSQRDLRARHSSPEPPYPEKSKMNDKSAEPSEVLWIGFPAQLKVDEYILRKSFSPFGEIDKITAFPGRTYAFVRYRNVMAACRAKETLQGKLFGNPRVHICFAKNDTLNRERSSMNGPTSPRIRAHGHLGSSDDFWQDRNIGAISRDPNLRSPRVTSNLEPRDSDSTRFGRKSDLWSGGNAAFEQRRFPEAASERELPGNVYERHNTPPRDRVLRFRDSSPPQYLRQGQFYEEPWDLPEDTLLFREPKKLKTSFFPPENELPEYPFSDSEQSKHRMHRDFLPPEAYDKNFDSRPFGHKQIAERAENLIQPYGDRSDQWNASFDRLPGGSVPLPTNSERKRLSSPEVQQSPPGGEWKWEGTIAKGGTPVCRARCFPVGKTLDMVLPDFLDCTARTSLDMLVKHYYQAANAWVVFFVPANDPDIAFYNEFMNYLGEKQRAAVAKLDDRTTLFLVPPSEFSEKVLKVPGKLSISGLVLRLEPPEAQGSVHHEHEKKDTNFTTFHEDTLYLKPLPPSGPLSYSNIERPGISTTSASGNFAVGASAPFSGSTLSVGATPNSGSGNRQEYMPQQNPTLGPNWSPHDFQSVNSSSKNIALQASNHSISQGYNPLMPRTGQDNAKYAREVSSFSSSGTSKHPIREKSPTPSSMPAGNLQPEQLAQLASSLLGQQRQSGSVSSAENFRLPGIKHQPENTYRPAQRYPFPNHQVSEISQSQFGHMQTLQLQQTPPVPAPTQREYQSSGQVSQQPQDAGQDDGDPQKRLQATLQLAAALLQQIQQGKGT